MVSYSAVPQILKDLPQWIVWKLERRNGKPTKVPYDAKKSGAYAKSNDVSTWTSFEQAVDASENIVNDYDGVGFMLQGTDLIGIDFDGVIHDGTAEPFVLDILEKMGNPYCEITPSGNGLRAFVQCAGLPPGQRKFSGNKYGAEIYSGGEGGRYLTVTGNHFSGSGVPKLENLDLPYFLVSQIRNEKLKKLWTGDLSEYGEDQSRADLALLDILALLFNRDPKKVEWAFTASKLGQREKWRDRKDYRERTIAKAVASNISERPAEFRGSRAPADASNFPPSEPVFVLGTDIKPRKINWFWQDRVPFGKITLFAGNPDNGKSLAAVSLAAICTSGKNFTDCDNTTPPSEVLMMLGEDDLDDTAIPRLMAAGADLSKIHFFECMRRPANPDSAVRLDWDLEPLREKLEKHPSIRLVIIDPISNYLGEVSMIAEQEVRSILIPLKRIAAQLNVAFVLVMHLNKKNELDAISRVGGAMAFIGVSRCSWMFIRDASTEEGEVKDSFVMARIKNNLVSAAGGGLAYRTTVRSVPIGDNEFVIAPFVEWGAKVNKTADDAIEANRSARRGPGPGHPEGVAPELQKALHWLSHALQDGARAQKWLKEHADAEANISWATLRRAKEQLGVVSSKVGAEWLWELPEVRATAQDASNDSPADEECDHIEREFGLQ